jgi:hypothetical protein
MEVLIQMGDKTHHQDQAIFPISLSVMNTTVRRPAKPMLPDELLDELLMISEEFSG